MSRLPQILVSWGSIFPAFIRSVKWAAKIAKAAGYVGLQGLPTRGIPDHTAQQYVREVNAILPIRLFEDVWNPSTEGWGFLDKLFFEDGISAAARYVALEQLMKQGALEIVHEFRRGALVEIHPGLWITPQEAYERAKDNEAEVVWDTYHVRRKIIFGPQKLNQPDGIREGDIIESWANWQDYLPLIVQYIRVVHVQPMRNTDELDRFIMGESTELEEMLVAIQRECQSQGVMPEYYVVEISPPEDWIGRLVWPFKLKGRLRGMAARLHVILQSA